MQATSIPRAPELTPLSLSHLCAKYLAARFRVGLNERSSLSIGASSASPVQPGLLPVALASELDLIALTLVDAFLNPIVIEWDVTCYSEKLPNGARKLGTKTSVEREASLKKWYPPGNMRAISSPCIIMDANGMIMSWYLPGILKDSRQSVMMAATEKLRPLLKIPTSTSWRDDPRYYRPGTQAPTGSVNISPSWFQLAHETVQDRPGVGGVFNSLAAFEWLEEFMESNSVMSAILVVIHPKLYKAGLETFDYLRNAAKTAVDIKGQNVLSRWTSAFNGVSVIGNRVAPLHRDVNSRFPWYDLLITLGSYRDCTLELPGIGCSLEYGPGTVVGLSGMALAHEVPKFDGERVCYAYFMRDNVHEWANVRGEGWMNTEYYK